MYVPKKFENNDASKVQQFIRENGFGILISRADDLVNATHVPMLLNPEGTTLSGHLSKANPHWKNFQANAQVLAIFNGPHAYISSSWYNHENVPTWNYIAVHVHGEISILEGEALYSSLKQMVDKYEKHSQNPISLEKMSAAYVQKQMNSIVGFEIQISGMQAAYKLSQNRDETNYHAIVDALEKRNHMHDKEVANEMKMNVPLN